MKIVIGLVVIIVIFLVVVAFQPADFRIVRSATIPAPPTFVFTQVNDLHKWQAWSPWAKMDPSAKYTFEGPPAGTGAISAWVGNSKVGEGRMTITESRPNDLIKMRLDFVKPFASTANAEYAFKPEGNQTVVTWSMSGRNNFFSKAVCMFMNMDKMVGGQFEEGLANLKTVAETANRK